jgi:hypothetical protein
MADITVSHRRRKFPCRSPHKWQTSVLKIVVIINFYVVFACDILYDDLIAWNI